MGITICDQFGLSPLLYNHNAFLLGQELMLNKFEHLEQLIGQIYRNNGESKIGHKDFFMIKLAIFRRMREGHTEILPCTKLKMLAYVEKTRLTYFKTMCGFHEYVNNSHIVGEMLRLVDVKR